MSDNLDKEVLMWNIHLMLKLLEHTLRKSARNAELIISRFLWFQFIFLINTIPNTWINQDSTMISEVSRLKCELNMHIILSRSTAHLERSQTSRRFQRRKSRISVTRLVILAWLSLNTRLRRFIIYCYLSYFHYEEEYIFRYIYSRGIFTLF